MGNQGEQDIDLNFLERQTIHNNGDQTTSNNTHGYHNGDQRAVMLPPQVNLELVKCLPNNSVLHLTLNHNPETDKVFAHSLQIRNYFAYFFGFLGFIIFVSCILVIAADTKNEYENMVKDEQLKIENCHKTYEENRCYPHQRVPALYEFCLELEMCINADPRKVAKKTSAFSTLVAENVNKLFGNLKLQSIVVICILLFGSIISCNLFLTRENRKGSVPQFNYSKKHN